jgi:hypothetical protein
MQNFVVPEPRDRETLRSKPCVARGVVSIFGVLRAVAFDDDPTFKAGEFNDEVADGNLTPPFCLSEPSIAQETPKRHLGVCRLNAHRSCASLGERSNGAMKRWHDYLTLASVWNALLPLREKVAARSAAG